MARDTDTTVHTLFGNQMGAGMSHKRLSQWHVGRLPDPLAHPPLHLKHLPRYAQVQRSQEPPERALRRRPPHLEDPGQHGLSLQKTQAIQPRETDVAGQRHGQHELIHGHGPGLSPHGEPLFHQLPEA